MNSQQLQRCNQIKHSRDECQNTAVRISNWRIADQNCRLVSRSWYGAIFVFFPLCHLYVNTLQKNILSLDTDSRSSVRFVFTSSFFLQQGSCLIIRRLCLFAYSGVQHILCCVFCFVCLLLVSCVPYGASFSGLSIFDCLFGIL